MKVAVIVPCKNEVQNIIECIESIYSNQINSDVELFVSIVDGMSTDGTRELIVDLQKRYKNLELRNNPMQYTPFAFNIGISSVEADFYQIVGARQILSTNYLQGAIDVLKNDESIWCVGGRVENIFQNDKGKVIASAMSTALGMGLGNFRTIQKSCFVDTVGTPMYPAWVFDKIGYFDENLVRNQDDDFNYRVSKAGGKIYYENEISLRYYVRGNFKNLYKQFFQYGYWKVYVNKKHKAVTTVRQLVPPMFVLFAVLSLPISLIGGFLATMTGFVWATYLVLNIVFSAKTATNITDFFQLLFTYPLLHVSYGFGYLKGIFHFLILGQGPSDKEKKISR